MVTVLVDNKDDKNPNDIKTRIVAVLKDGNIFGVGFFSLLKFKNKIYFFIVL